MSRPWFKFWIAGWKTPGVRMLSKPARADFVDLLCVMYQSKDGFCTTPAGKRLNRKQAVGLAGIEDANLSEMIECGVVELVDGCPFCPKVAEVIADREKVSEERSESGKKGAQKRWQLPSENMANAPGFATEKHSEEEEEVEEDRRQKKQDPISLSLDSQGHPAPARPRDETDEEWAKEILGAFEQLTHRTPGAADHRAVLQTLKTYRAYDLLLAIEGARHNKWAQEQSARMTLRGIVSPTRIDGHIQDAMISKGLSREAATTWAEAFLSGGAR
jgi:hypothetical protein